MGIQLLHLSCGPNRMVTRYSGYIVNGFRFHTYKREIRRQTQNSGVIVKGDEESGSSEYFGVLTDILELEYGGRNKIVLFKCDWWDTYNEGRGYKKEANGLTFVNTTRHLATNEPYVLASQPAIEIPEELRRVVGTNAQQFITETAQIIKQNAPLNVEKWSKMPPHIIDRMVKVVNVNKYLYPCDFVSSYVITLFYFNDLIGFLYI